jgi:ATP-dependent DNA helicase RecG
MRLKDPISEHFRLIETHKSALSRLGIHTVRDMLYYFPHRYDMAGEDSTISALTPGQEVTLVGTLEKMETKKSWKSRIPISEGFIRDQTGRIKCRWFNQPYIAKLYQDGALVQATGKVTGVGEKMYLANPRLERVSATDAGLFKGDKEKQIQLGGEGPTLYAMYPETRGISSLWFRHALSRVMSSGVLDEIEDGIPADLLKKYNLPSLRTALVWVHTPEKLKDAEAARKRFAFEEVFLIQLERGRERAEQAREKSFVIDPPASEVNEFMADFPFIATVAQTRATNAILKDLKSGAPMSRLLEGDVGSGKTAVAATAAYATVRTKPAGQNFGTLQVAYMAPTEILAKQHFESFIKYFENFPINIGLITGSGCFKFPSKAATKPPIFLAPNYSSGLLMVRSRL